MLLLSALGRVFICRALEKSEAVVCRCSAKYVFSKNSQYSQESACVGVIKLQVFMPATLLKRNSNIRAFQLLLTNYLSVFDHFVELALKGLTEFELENINQIGD